VFAPWARVAEPPAAAIGGSTNGVGALFASSGFFSPPVAARPGTDSLPRLAPALVQFAAIAAFEVSMLQKLFVSALCAAAAMVLARPAAPQ